MFDDLLDRQYDYETYNCAHFVAEVVKRFGGDVSFMHECSPRPAMRGSLQRLPGPESPCIALFYGGPAVTPHSGVWYNGKILHITESGVSYMPLPWAMQGFKKVRFFKW